MELLVAGGDDDQVINSCVSTCTTSYLVVQGDECYVPEMSGSPRCRRCTGIVCCQVGVVTDHNLSGLFKIQFDLYIFNF